MTETYQAAAELLPDNATGEAAPRLPGSLWTFTLLGLSLALGITIRGKNPRRLLWLLPLGLLAFVPLNSCKKEAGVTLGFNAEEEVFLQDYYLARRAAGWWCWRPGKPARCGASACIRAGRRCCLAGMSAAAPMACTCGRCRTAQLSAA
ncbi:MAG TPA: hypothetical protein PK198_27390, partial [Saprospiraceae bacterium]|nr:hypothetical protein [Saprospiraceae bacterium]